TLLVLGSDGQSTPSTSVERWLKHVELKSGLPPTLFLLDLCHAGHATRRPWQLLTAAGRTRAYVLAATKTEQSAYDGRFTRAVIDSVRKVADGGFDIPGAYADVSMRQVFIDIAKGVTSSSAGRYRQQVEGSVMDLSVADPEHPFFPNITPSPL